MDFQLLGTGSPLVDYSLSVTETLLERFVPGGKGGTRNISEAEKSAILKNFNGTVLRTPGGSAANTVRTFAAIGGKAALFGKTGCDADADFFTSALRNDNVDDALICRSGTVPTGFCLSLITPDAERTMLSNLGASLCITGDDMAKIDFAKFDYLLLEGYLISEPWVDKLLALAESSGCKIALDLNNFELAARAKTRFTEIISRYVSLLFGNEQEISALLECSDRAEQLSALRRFTETTVFKLGSKGALIVLPDELITVDACKVDTVKDTTGAGDFFAAGFFYGMSRHCSPAVCGRLGAVCASHIIAETGTILSEQSLQSMIKHINDEVQNEL